MRCSPMTPHSHVARWNRASAEPCGCRERPRSPIRGVAGSLRPRAALRTSASLQSMPAINRVRTGTWCYFVSIGSAILCTVIGSLVGGFIASLWVVTIGTVRSMGPPFWIDLTVHVLSMQPYATFFALPHCLLLAAPSHA